MISESTYLELLDNCAIFNRRISGERCHRMPFLDAQTGVAQNISNLWRQKRDRRPGPDPSIVFTYPAKRWHKKNKSSSVNLLIADIKNRINQDAAAAAAVASVAATVGAASREGGGANGAESCSNSGFGGTGSQETAGEFGDLSKLGGSSVDSKNQSFEAKSEFGGDKDSMMNTTRGNWYDDLSDQALDEPDDLSDGDDYDDKKKRKKKKGNPKSRRQNTSECDIEKPYACIHCGAKYKTKPGLHYHLTHAHVDLMHEHPPSAVVAAAVAAHHQAMADAQMPRLGPPTSVPGMGGGGGYYPQHHPQPPQQQRKASSASAMPPSLLEMGAAGGGASGHPSQPGPPPPGGSGPPPAQLMMPPPQLPPAAPGGSTGAGGSRNFAAVLTQYCDFCLGDAQENKKTNRPEELISCKDCGRAGHPTCLQFTPNMIISTKRHGWQCIECKSCAMCGTSENDDQLLFCDDCDRGFHMYCLKPPLSAPPEGSWSCHLCVVEFGATASNPASQSH